MAVTPNTNANVDVGRFKVGGYAFSGPMSATTPTDATADLHEQFENMGYISKEGVEVTEDRESSDHEDVNGDVVESTQDRYGVTITCTFIESLRGELLKRIHGADNVIIEAPTTQKAGSIKVKRNSAELEPAKWVFEMASRKAKKRKVAPNARIVSTGSQKFVSNELISYQATIKCYPDANGDSFLEFASLPKLSA